MNYTFISELYFLKLCFIVDRCDKMARLALRNENIVVRLSMLSKINVISK